MLHWSQNVKAHFQRKHVSREIGGFEELTIISVVVHKSSFLGTGTGLSDHVKLYNYAVRFLMERLSWFARDQAIELIPVFAHVKRFPYDRLTRYLNLLRNLPTQIKWEWLRRHRIEQPDTAELLQLADLVSGAVYLAVTPDAYGDHEPTYLLEIAPRLYVRTGGSVSSYGLKFCALDGHAQSYPWWRDLEEWL